MLVYPALVPHTWLGPHQLGPCLWFGGEASPCVFNPWPLPLLCCRYQPSAQMHNLKWQCLWVKQGIHLHKEHRYTGNMHSSTRLITIYAKLSNSTLWAQTLGSHIYPLVYKVWRGSPSDPTFSLVFNLVLFSHFKLYIYSCGPTAARHNTSQISSWNPALFRS